MTNLYLDGEDKYTDENGATYDTEPTVPKDTTHEESLANVQLTGRGRMLARLATLWWIDIHYLKLHRTTRH